MGPLPAFFPEARPPPAESQHMFINEEGLSFR
jgi:hypothetical protein